MKLAQYIWKAGLLKIKNIKFMTFAIVMMVVTWSYNRPLKALAEVVNYPVSWCVSVSYTHLDVYKRQILCSSNE